MQDYRRLRVWRKSHELVLSVRAETDRFPKTGFASLKAQMNSAAESIPFNIVEGCGADSGKEFARFLTISIRSSKELEYQLVLARDYRVLKADQWTTLTDETVDSRRMLCGLKKKVLSEKDEGTETE